MLGEIGSVIQDAKKSNGDLQHRGHVAAISQMCFKMFAELIGSP